MTKFSENEVSVFADVMAGKINSETPPKQETPPAATGGDEGKGAQAGGDGTNGETNGNEQQQNNQQQQTSKTPEQIAAEEKQQQEAAARQQEYQAQYLQRLGYKTEDELQATLKKVPDLERQLNELNEYKAGPKFASDRAKLIYDFANKVEGMETERFRQFLDIVALDLNKTPDQRLRFEAFKLRPENKGLSQEEVSSLFQADEQERFGNSQDIENPPTQIQIIRAKQATAQAKDELAKLQSEWNSASTEQKSPEDIARENQQHRQFLQTELSGFKGINLALKGTDEEGKPVEGALNFELGDAENHKAILEAIADPQGWWDQELEAAGIVGENKPNNYKAFAELVTFVKHRNEIMNQVYNQGATDALARKLKASRQVADPATTTGGAPAPPVEQDERKKANQAAMKAIGLG